MNFSIQCTQHTEYYLIVQCCVIEHTDHEYLLCLAQPCTAFLCSLLVFHLWFFFSFPRLRIEHGSLPSHDQEKFNSQALSLVPALHSPALAIAQQMSHPMQQPYLSLCTYMLAHIYTYREKGRKIDSLNPRFLV